MNYQWKQVPVEPTDEMEAAAENDYEQTGATFPRWKSAYAAMLAAAPTPPASAQDDALGSLYRDSDETICFQPARDFHVTDGMPVFASPVAGDGRDAARYRWLRTALFQQWFAVGEAEIGMRVYGACPTEADIDAAIDEAIAASQQQEG